MSDLIDELRKTMAYLESVPVVTEPFEHFLLQRPFSENLYRTLLHHLPADDAYDWGKGQVATEHQRGCFYLNPCYLRRLPPAKRSTWEQVRHWVLSGDFVSVLLNKYRQSISRRFSVEPRGSILLGEVKLIRDKCGYALQPHTDRPNRVTTIMFYLPQNFELEDCGTAIYRPHNVGQRCSGFKRHSYDDFELLSKASFVPNSGLCFLKSDRSFHGVEPIERAGTRRDFATFSIRCVKEGPRKKARRCMAALRGNQPNYRLAHPAEVLGMVHYISTLLYVLDFNPTIF